MILLLAVLIAYDTLVVIDPTQCFFFSCKDAQVVVSNATANTIVTGWPLYITWPSYFQTAMNAKRIFQSIQGVCAFLYINFASLYVLTYYIYRHIYLAQRHADHRVASSHETRRASSPKYTSRSVPPSTQYHPNQRITVYHIEGQPNRSTNYMQPSPAPSKATTPAPIYVPPSNPPRVSSASPRKSRARTRSTSRARSSSEHYDRLCTRCNKENRMLLTTAYERQNYFTYLCSNCNYELAAFRRKAPTTASKNSRIWIP